MPKGMRIFDLSEVKIFIPQSAEIFPCDLGCAQNNEGTEDTNKYGKLNEMSGIFFSPAPVCFLQGPSLGGILN